MYLIEEYQRLARYDVSMRERTNASGDFGHVEASLVDGIEFIIPIATDICDTLKFIFAKFFEDISLATLSHTVEYERFVLFVILLFYQFLVYFSFHCLHDFTHQTIKIQRVSTCRICKLLHF